MFQFTKQIKNTAFALMIIGAVGIILGFFNAPSTVEEAQEMMQHDTHHGHAALLEDDNSMQEHHDGAHDAHHDTHATEAHATHGDHDAHAEHLFHQLKNRPWAAVYVAAIFFLFITLAVLAFNAIQRVAQSGWSIVLFRVMEGISGNLLPMSIVVLVLLLLGAFHIHHLFVWMEPGTVDPNSANYDAIIDGKSWWLNVPGWLFRAVLAIAGWNVYRIFSRKLSVAQDNANDLSSYKKNFKYSVLFLVFFLTTESIVSWDWIMSIDPHWFSTLFAWYILASALVSAITVIAMVTVYLKSKGYLPYVNDSHIHDLAKFMFGFSVFWTYLWFSQFLLIWYADMPEETTYYVQRINEFKLPFLGMVVLNFIFPVLVLVNSDYKRIPHFVIGTGVVILIGHYIDFFIMIMPGTVGDQWQIGLPEISALLFFLGVFIYAVFNTLSKAPLLAKGNPFLHESETFHY